MSDQGAPRLETLLNKQDLQEILHGWGSPTYYLGMHKYGSSLASRYFIHAFTGRVPTPAEMYYGTFINKTGDLVSNTPHDLADAYLGWIGIRTDLSADAHYYRAGGNADTEPSPGQATIDAEVSGRVFPEGISLVKGYTHYIRLPVKEHHDTSMMMSVTFSPSAKKHWHGGNKAALKTAHDEGRLVHGFKPTWFYISENLDFPARDTQKVMDRDNQHIATINSLQSTHFSRLGVLYGRFGSVGSGAEIELSDGYENNIYSATLVSLKIKSN
ncbi:hypothetical protein HUZ36_14365 [Pseudoalteromonas sp. McH1-7]|uniref:Uncharacterized protein n=1 Tax=Pseudoalteromonas peptidolytica F12-50-A1 TaxID=1315280 RepID=A0A8I0T5C6_9GAMM|nr:MULTISPECIES: hypothetical protein [Pseudoalteromonas]MBE0347925.1 hypothetical protein [Pseudoalteromonas peptidolytica F12-50-A1]NLR15280.1 hypothetical protein [Pseudoalteromonas peptidolytica]NUZ11969.1 hypothetical protein [Pseudoalteromonas sp. McH1-7]GEK08039.1 hypothetical protein PPE03_02880 [Pseudoalteromonas peptidolytica]